MRYELLIRADERAVTARRNGRGDGELVTRAGGDLLSRGIRCDGSDGRTASGLAPG
jgi:hypothetical protein